MSRQDAGQEVRGQEGDMSGRRIERRRGILFYYKPEWVKGKSTHAQSSMYGSYGSSLCAHSLDLVWLEAEGSGRANETAPATAPATGSRWDAETITKLGRIRRNMGEWKTAQKDGRPRR